MQKLLSSEPYSSTSFTLINGQVVKAILTVKGSEINVEDPTLNETILKMLVTTGGSISAAQVNLAIGAASEDDLRAAQRANAAKSIEIEKLLTFVRAQKDAQAAAASAPLRVEITNASEFADKRATVVKVERGNDGLLSGAIAQKI